MAFATSGNLMADYEQRIADARRKFGKCNALTRIMAPHVDPVFLELFMIHFCADGVQMTAPVEGWINRAAARCREIGLDDIGEALRKHALAEAGHHLMMIADVHALVDRWNARASRRLDARELLDRPATPGAARYCRLHEENIEGDRPFAQFAIEYEIEILPVQYGTALIEQCASHLGRDFVACISFLTKHVELDVGHTKYNARQLRQVLAARPESLSYLAEQGSRILGAYGDFLDDCAVNADEVQRCLS